MRKHDGQILEYTIRRNGYNLSELSKDLNVNRRTLYNWFQMPRLKADILYRVGLIIRHNFSKEFPELFSSSQFEIPAKSKVEQEIFCENLWQGKYISLLEKYNALLLRNIVKDSKELISK